MMHVSKISLTSLRQIYTSTNPEKARPKHVWKGDIITQSKVWESTGPNSRFRNQSSVFRVILENNNSFSCAACLSEQYFMKQNSPATITFNNSKSFTTLSFTTLYTPGPSDLPFEIVFLLCKIV